MSGRARAWANSRSAIACVIAAMVSGACSALIDIPDRELAADAGVIEGGTIDAPSAADAGDAGDAGDANAITALAALTTSHGTLVPAFAPATRDYAVTVSDLFGDLPFTVTATAARDDVRITIDGHPATSGAESGPFSFGGLRTRGLPIVVSSPHGAEPPYDLQVTNAPRYTYVKPLNQTPYGQFGLAIALAGDTLIVGEPGESSSATGVNGDENNATAPGTGAVWVFVRAQTGWMLQAYLKASRPSASFGFSVAFSGETLVVGAPDEEFIDGSTTMYGAGAAFVFTRDGAKWTQQASLRASNPRPDTFFGQSVAIDGNTVAVGSYAESSVAAGINQDQTPDPHVPAAGAAYVFVRTGMTWSQQAYVKPSNTLVQRNLSFGWCVALSGETLAVGAPRESSSARGIEGNQGDTAASGAGAVYVFARAQGAWSQEAYIKASNTRADGTIGAGFGSSIALAGDILAVGAPNETSNGVGVGGDQNDQSAPNAGAVYLFSRDATQWKQEAYVKASRSRAYSAFGASVALSSERLAVGASSESSGSTGINGDEADAHLAGAGAAYLFERGASRWTQRGYVKASNTRANSFFGGAVTLDKDRVVVGASGESSNATGIDGQESDTSLPQAGAVYLLE